MDNKQPNEHLIQNEKDPYTMCLRLFCCGPSVWGFSSPEHQDDADVSLLKQLFIQAADWAKNRQLALECRLDSSRPVLHELMKTLPELGWCYQHTRLEFSADLADLPNESGTPLRFQSLHEQALSLAEITGVMKQAAVGDPDFDPNEDPLAVLQLYQSDPVLMNQDHCFQLAFYRHEPAGVIVAQAHSTQHWGRISYMALLPAMRRLGLGKWLHRHGFEMLRVQGAKRYYGGTVQGNRAMEHLFALHHCQARSRLQTWRL